MQLECDMDENDNMVQPISPVQRALHTSYWDSFRRGLHEYSEYPYRSGKTSNMKTILIVKNKPNSAG